MAKVKKQKKGVKRKGGIMGRSDIPFAQRVAMQHRSDIIVNRDHAAKITMFCMSVAMNELEGIELFRGPAGARAAYYISSFAALWDTTIPPADLHKYGWDANPWVWAIEFEKSKRPEEE